MRTDTITRADVEGRARVGKLALTNPAFALKTARAIKHPWYRCQSLSKVAEHMEGARKLDVIVEALKAAKELSEINRIVTVSAWPMRQLVHVQPEFAESEIKLLVGLAEAEPHTLRRADALFALAWSVSEVGGHLKLIVPSLVQALLGGHGWRNDRLIRYSVELVKKAQPEALDALIAHHAENRKKRQLLLSINELQI